MLDFKELPVDGVQFEQLVREMLLRSGFEVHWTGVGADGGRDLVATERASGSLAPFARRWLVSCKHKAHAGTSVVMGDIKDLTDACSAVDATGFLLACSTQPASSVVRRLEEIGQTGRLLTRFWDGIEIERRLDVPDLFPLIHQFFPKSARANPWRIYNTESPSFWAANYQDYFVYLSSRIAHTFPALEEVEVIAARLLSVKLPGKEWNRHRLRLRGVYFDDKHEQFSIFVDYLYPSEGVGDVLTPKQLDQVFRTGRGLHSDKTSEWYLANWDARYVEVSPMSDRFHADAKDFYEPYMSNFRIGHSRDGWLDEIEAPDPEEVEVMTLVRRRRPR
jgi:hypothetical protein